MATVNSRDVSLVIKAKDDATQALDGITSALNKLFGGQQQVAGSAKSTGASLAEMASIAANVDKAMASIATATSKAENGLSSLNNSIAKRKQDLNDFQQQAEMAARAIAQLSSPDGIVNAGRDQGQRITQLSAAKAAYDDLQKKIERTSTALAEEEQRLAGSRSSLQQLGSTAIAAAEQQEKLNKTLNDRREALAAINAEQERIANSRAFVDKLNANISPTLAGQSATSNGATFTALAAREEARELRDAAIAHELFENRVKAGVKAMREEEVAARSYNASLDELQRELNPLIALEDRYQSKLALLRQGYADGKIGATQLAEAEKLLANERKRGEADIARNGKQGISIFGLRPYELTNLSYQVNDVFTQLASGTSLTQTLAQQGGQILQLFPKVGSAIAAAFSNPYFLGAAAVLGVITFGIKQAADEADRLRTINASLDLNASGKNYNSAALLDSVHNMQALGASADEAMKSVKIFVDEGLRPERINQFGDAAINTARVLGQDIPTAAKTMGDAFTHGYDAVVKLDDATNFLTAAQREHIRTLFEQGKAEQARAEALDLFTNKMDQVAEKQRGPWEKAGRAMTTMWESFKTSLADTAPIQSAYNALSGLADLLDRIANATDGKRTIDDVRRELKSAQDEVDRLANVMVTASARTPQQLEWFRGRIAQLQATIAALTVEENRLKVSAGGGVTTNDPNGAAAKARNDKLAELSIDEQLQALRDKGAKGLTQQEKARREQLAGLVAIRGVEDAQVAAAEKRIAIEREHTKIQKEQETLDKASLSAAKAAAAEREKAINQFTGRVIGAEGGAAQNPNSSATGFGQFIDRTWLDQFKRVFSEQSKSMSNDQILALRNNATIAKAVIDNYARENAAFLERFGQKVTAGNLYLAHFLGAGDALKVLQAQGDTPVDQILSKKVMTANKGYLTTNGRARTADELEKFIAARVGDTGTAQSAGQAEIAKLQQDQVDAQDRFNHSVVKSNEERQRSIDAMRDQGMLQDSALIAAQKQIAIEKAEFDLKQKVADLNTNLKPGQDPIKLTQEQIDKTRQLAGAEFDLAKARDLAQAKTSEAQRPIDQLTAERDAIQARIEYLNQNGLYDQAKSLVPDLTETNSKLREAIDSALEFYQTLDLSHDSLHRTPEEIRAIIERLKTAKDETRQWVTVMGVGGKTIAQTFANGAVSAIDNFVQAIGEGKSAFASLWDAFRTFAANFLLQIAQMIQQQIIFNLVSGLLKGIGGSVGGSAGSAFGAANPFVPTTVAHTGGVIGQDSLQSRLAAPAWFMNATRYHTGGVIGLAPDERAIIARAGEEMLTADDPRHRNNGGLNSSDGPPTIINAFDAAEMLSRAFETKAGKKVILNFVGNNARAFQQAMGGN